MLSQKWTDIHIPWDLDIVPRMKIDWTLPQTLSLEEIEKLIDTAENIRNKAIIALVYSSGLRAGEVVRLAPGDIYMSTMQVHVRNSKNRGDHYQYSGQVHGLLFPCLLK